MHKPEGTTCSTHGRYGRALTVCPFCSLNGKFMSESHGLRNRNATHLAEQDASVQKMNKMKYFFNTF